MRFFLVRILVFTVVFTLLLLLLSWIAPTWTGKTVSSLTRRWPVAERTVESDDELVVTDLSSDSDAEDDTTDAQDQPTDDGDVAEATDDESVVDTPEQTDAIVVEKSEDYIQQDAIKAMDDLLGVDDAPVASESSDTVYDYEPTPPTPTITPDQEIESLPANTQLSPEEQRMLEEFEENTY